MSNVLRKFKENRWTHFQGVQETKVQKPKQKCIGLLYSLSSDREHYHVANYRVGEQFQEMSFERSFRLHNGII